MSSFTPSEVERYLTKRGLPRKVGIVRVTGPAANEAPCDFSHDPQGLLMRSRELRARVMVSWLKRSAAFVSEAAKTVYRAVEADRAKRQTYRTLASLNESMLRDIGVGARTNIAAVVETVHATSGAPGGERPVSHAWVELSRQESANELDREAVA